MTEREFYLELRKPDPSISWKDILENSFQKRPFSAVERQLYQTRPPMSPSIWEGWQRPWVWWSFSKYGLALVGILYASLYGVYFSTGNYAVALADMVMIVPPIVIPFLIMVLLWELNVPRNISFFELLAYFVLSGIISFAITSLTFMIFPSGLPSYYAAVREEPAKLGATLLILVYMERKQNKKIYGLTGLVVGAAVGAAFSAFESVSYAINYSSDLSAMIDVQLTRALLALGGHITYCLPYATAITLNAQNGAITEKSVFNISTIGAFVFSVLLHAIWNGVNIILVPIIIVIASVFILLHWVKKALKEAACLSEAPVYAQQEAPQYGAPPAYAQQGAPRYGTAPAYGRPAVPRPYQPAAPRNAHEITICIKNSALAGSRWRSHGDAIVIGRQSGGCQIQFPDSTQGVSRRHCQIILTQRGWAIQDLGSTFGTYVGGRKLQPNETYLLRRGEIIFLASRQIKIVVEQIQ